MLLDTLPKALDYVEKSGRDYEEAKQNWDYFKKAWETYVADRKIQDGKSDPVFPLKYGVAERDAFYKQVSWDGWGGSSGHDAPMIA